MGQKLKTILRRHEEFEHHYHPKLFSPGKLNAPLLLRLLLCLYRIAIKIKRHGGEDEVSSSSCNYYMGNDAFPGTSDLALI